MFKQLVPKKTIAYQEAIKTVSSMTEDTFTVTVMRPVALARNDACKRIHAALFEVDEFENIRVS